MSSPLRRVRIYTDRRVDTASPVRHDLRTYCWQLEGCAQAVRAACHAYIVGENCWDFWTIRGANRRSCCHRLDDCRECPLAQSKFTDELPIHAVVPAKSAAATLGAACNYLHFTAGKLPDGQTLGVFLREQVLADRDVFRCAKRGVHLDPSYVQDICAVRSSRDCVFLL